MAFAASPPPLCRGIAALLTLYGATLATSLEFLAAGLLTVVGVLWAQGNLRPFLKFSLAVLLPVGVGLVIIWGFIRQGAPGAATEASVKVGLSYACTTTLRLALMAGLLLAAVLGLPPERLGHLLQTFCIRGRTLAIVISTLNLWPDFRRQAEQVFAGRCARGLMPDRRLRTRVRQLPYAIRTLFVSALGQGLDRADSWESSGLMERLEHFSAVAGAEDGYSRRSGLVWLVLAVAWAAAGTLQRFGT